MACPACLGRGLLLRALAGRIDRAVDHGVSRRARDLLALDDRSLSAAVGTGTAEALEASRSPRAIAELERELSRLGCWAVCRHEGDWPPELDLLDGSAPRAVFGAGSRARLARLRDRPAVTLVGSRRAGPYGLEIASSLAEGLACAGLAVISGMALGADSAAHRGALRAGGLTVAVLGAGPERAYPRSAARLYDEIRERGLAISELPPGSPTFRWTFPARNRLMAALAGITVVVEAAERSGSLITAEMAADCGRLVGAVPGPVNSWRSAGANLLIADGAALIRDARDVLEQLLGPGRCAPRPTGPPLAGEERAVLDAIEAGAGGPDAVALATGLGGGAVSAAIARLELAGYLQLDYAGGWRRTAMASRRDPGGAESTNTMSR